MLAMASLDHLGGDEDSFYVQSFKVNGRDRDRSWETWYDIFTEGSKLEFVLGGKSTNWTTGVPPPSLGCPTPVAAMKLMKPWSQ